MRHGREWWRGHVEAWQTSGLSQAEYGRRHGVVACSLARWASKLRSETGNGLVEVAKGLPAEVKERPIELVVDGRYLMRLWPGTDRHHLGEVLSVLEDRV